MLMAAVLPAKSARTAEAGEFNLTFDIVQLSPHAPVVTANLSYRITAGVGHTSWSA